jgi:hypothetical protein
MAGNGPLDQSAKPAIIVRLMFYSKIMQDGWTESETTHNADLGSALAEERPSGCAVALSGAYG